MLVPIYVVREKSCTLKFSNVAMITTLVITFSPLYCCFSFEILSLIYLVWFTLRGLPLEVGFPGSSDGKDSACNAGDPGLIPGSERSPGEGNDCPLQYSCLENPVDRGAWWATVHGVTKSRTWLSHFTSLHKLQEILKDREAWCAVVHEVVKHQTRLSDWTTTKWVECQTYIWVLISLSLPLPHQF